MSATSTDRESIWYWKNPVLGIPQRTCRQSRRLSRHIRPGQMTLPIYIVKCSMFRSRTHRVSRGQKKKETPTCTSRSNMQLRHFSLVLWDSNPYVLLLSIAVVVAPDWRTAQCRDPVSSLPFIQFSEATARKRPRSECKFVIIWSTDEWQGVIYEC